MKLSRRFTVTALPAAVILFSGQAPAQQMGGMGPGWQVPSPYSGMFGSMGNVYSPYYRQFHSPGMAGMPGMAGSSGQGQGQARAEPSSPGMPQPPAWPASAVVPPPLQGSGSSGNGPYPSPYQGMFGSMGNVYSPYYRQFHPPGMSGSRETMPGSGM